MYVVPNDAMRSRCAIRTMEDVAVRARVEASRVVLRQIEVARFGRILSDWRGSSYEKLRVAFSGSRLSYVILFV